MTRNLAILLVLVVIAIAVYFNLPDINLESDSKVSSYLKNDSRRLRLDKTIKIKSSESLNINQGNNLVISIWVKFKNLPSERFRDVLFSKVDDKAGFALAIKSINNKLYPQVYWGEVAGWLTFSDFKFKTGRWYQFILSYSDDQVVGLKVNKKQKKAYQLVNLGGYNANPIKISKETVLKLGSANNKFADFQISTLLIYNLPKKELELAQFYNNLEKSDPPFTLDEYQPVVIDLSGK